MKLLTKIKRFSHTIETKIQANNYQRKDIFDSLRSNNQNQIFSGYYNRQGFEKYTLKTNGAHFKSLISDPSIRISSIGVGTYKGSLDEMDDLQMFNGLVDSINSGCNVIDTCRNFRGGRSQQIIGSTLSYLIKQQGYTRNNFFIGSKAGYVRDNLPKSVSTSEVINDHCVHPDFLKVELDRSLASLKLSTIDVYYLNNFAECQIEIIQQAKFFQRLEKAFAFFEQSRANNKIKYYGLSSWQSFRLPTGDKNHLSLQKVYKIAQRIGGKDHGFRFVQVPINLMMPQVFAERYTKDHSFLDVAQQLKINLISNSPLLSGSLINIPLPSNMLRCSNNGAKHLQLIRSIPSRALVSTLIGQKLNRHVKKNLQVLVVPPLDQGQWLNVFVPTTDAKPIQQQRQSL